MAASLNAAFLPWNCRASPSRLPPPPLALGAPGVRLSLANSLMAALRRPRLLMPRTRRLLVGVLVLVLVLGAAQTRFVVLGAQLVVLGLPGSACARRALGSRARRIRTLRLPTARARLTARTGHGRPRARDYARLGGPRSPTDAAPPAPPPPPTKSSHLPPRRSRCPPLAVHVASHRGNRRDGGPTRMSPAGGERRARARAARGCGEERRREHKASSRAHI